MRLYRSSLLAALLALASTSMLHAASTGTLTCTGTGTINISYFDIAAPTTTSTVGSQSGGAGAGKVTFGTLTVHAALAQFANLAASQGSNYTSCVLTHNSIQFTLTVVTLTNVDGIAGAASTGGAGAATYTQAVFAVGGITVNGGSDGDGGGDDGGWNRITNPPNPNVPPAS